MPVLVGWPYKFLTRQCLGQNVRIFGLLESSLGFLIGIPEPDIAHAHLVDMNVCFFNISPSEHGTWSMDVYGWSMNTWTWHHPVPHLSCFFSFCYLFFRLPRLPRRSQKNQKEVHRKGHGFVFWRFSKYMYVLTSYVFKLSIFQERFTMNHDPSWFSTSFVIFHHLSSSFIIIHHHLSPSHTYTTMSPSASLLLSSNTFAQAWSPYPFIPERRWGYS